MATPRIYLYKITFEEVPYFYYGIHSERKYNEHYMGSPIKNKWAWKIYTPKKQILQEFDSWEQATLIEKRVIKYFLGRDPNCLNACAGGAFLNGRGKDNHRYGTKWWNNGIKNKIAMDCPGQGWKRGKLSKSRKYKSGKESPNANKRWWNNKKEEVFTETKPDDSWERGRIKKAYLYERRKPLTIEHKEKLSKSLKGKMAGNKNPMSKDNYSFTQEHIKKLSENSSGRKWWNNGIKNKFQKNQPGPDWVEGMITRTQENNNDIY